MKILGIGNAIIDVICKVDDNFLKKNGLTKEVPPDLETLHKYVDYDLQFEKSFLEPLKFIVESINWKIEKTNDLTAFFE